VVSNGRTAIAHGYTKTRDGAAVATFVGNVRGCILRIAVR
jgi:hypothetical protein